MANKTAKQRFQFKREYNLKGQLLSLHGSMLNIRKRGLPMTHTEEQNLWKAVTFIDAILLAYDANTTILKEAKFGKQNS